MTGSEKQIKWATEIMANVNPVMDWAVENAPENLKSQFAQIKDTVNNAYAGKVINCWKDLSLTGDNRKDLNEVFGAYKSYQKFATDENKF